MKRFLCVLLFAALLLCPARALSPAGESDIPLDAPAALLMEKTTGTVLFEKNADEQRPIASVTKIMTLLLLVEAIEEGTLSPEETVTVSAHAASMAGSQIYLAEGEQMSVHDMLKSIAVSSANDAAVAMAEHLAGSETAFVAKMNAKAEALGMTNSHFTDCTGLFDDPQHYSTARDVAIMARALIAHDLIKTYSTIWTDSVRNGEFGLSNTNRLIRYYDGATGLKTGFTSRAMYCLAATAQRDGTEYIAVVLGCETSDRRFESARALLNYAFANYRLVSLRAEQALPPIPVSLGQTDAVQPVYDGAETALLDKAQAAELSCTLELAEELEAPVEAGQSIGTLTVRSGDTVVAQRELLAETGVARLTTWQIFLRLLARITGA